VNLDGVLGLEVRRFDKIQTRDPHLGNDVRAYT
jgi:hypothetical protein